MKSVKKVIYQGPDHHCYAVGVTFPEIMEELNGTYILKGRKKIWHLRNTTLHYTCKNKNNETTVTAYGSQKAISKIEKIIHKAAREIAWRNL